MDSVQAKDKVQATDTSQESKINLNDYSDYSAMAFVKKQKEFKKADTQRSLEHEFIMITGGNSAIAHEAAIKFAKKGAQIYLVCRDATRGQKDVDLIKQKSASEKIELLTCDFSQLDDVFKFAQNFINSEPKKPLTVLCINHSKIYPSFKLLKKKDDTDKKYGIYEATFAVNTLSIHILVTELAPLLREIKYPKVIITTSSVGLSVSLDKDGQNITLGQPYSGLSVFNQTKRQNIEMARYYKKKYSKEIFLASWHPGYVDTPGLEGSQPELYRALEKILRSPEQGADTLVWLVCHSLRQPWNGELFFDREIVAKSLKDSNNEVSETFLNKFMFNLDRHYHLEKKYYYTEILNKDYEIPEEFK